MAYITEVYATTKAKNLMALRLSNRVTYYEDVKIHI